MKGFASSQFIRRKAQRASIAMQSVSAGHAECTRRRARPHQVKRGPKNLGKSSHTRPARSDATLCLRQTSRASAQSTPKRFSPAWAGTSPRSCKSAPQKAKALRLQNKAAMHEIRLLRIMTHFAGAAHRWWAADTVQLAVTSTKRRGGMQLHVWIGTPRAVGRFPHGGIVVQFSMIGRC